MIFIERFLKNYNYQTVEILYNKKGFENRMLLCLKRKQTCCISVLIAIICHLIAMQYLM